MSKILCPCLMIFEEQNDAVYAPLWCIRKVGEAGQRPCGLPWEWGDLISAKQLGPLWLIIIFNWFRLACQNCTVAFLPLQRLFCRGKVQNIFYFPVASSIGLCTSAFNLFIKKDPPLFEDAHHVYITNTLDVIVRDLRY